MFFQHCFFSAYPACLTTICFFKPSLPNEEEEITTLTYTLVSESDSTDIVEFISNDIDGEGGNDATITNDTLKSNTVYEGMVKVENVRPGMPTENITEEVQEEADEHQFFYISRVSGLSISYVDDDVDENGNPVGIKTTLTTGSARQGTLSIILRHQLNKTAEGIRIDTPNNVGGETDIQATFNVVINDQ